MTTIIRRLAGYCRDDCPGFIRLDDDSVAPCVRCYLAATEVPLYKRDCRTCGLCFFTSQKDRMFCCNVCDQKNHNRLKQIRRAAQKETRPPKEKPIKPAKPAKPATKRTASCAKCGKVFAMRNTASRYCSKRCQVATRQAKRYKNDFTAFYQDKTVKIKGCDNCKHGKASTISDSGWECVAFLGARCKPWGSAEMWLAKA